MQLIRYNGHTLEMYDSITELPITRYQEYNRYVMIDSGIGSDMNDADGHILTLRRLVAAGKMEEADTQLVNMRQNLAFVVSNTSPRMNSFVPLIATMNGRPVSDLSPENVQKLLAELDRKGLTAGKVLGFLTAVKKKWSRSLRSSFQRFRIAPTRKSTSAA